MKKIMLVLSILFLMVGCTSSNNTNEDTFIKELLVNDKLIIATSPDYPPYETIGDDGEIVGFDIDMINEVVQIINEQNNTELTIEFKPMDFGLIVGSLEAKQIDLGVSGFTYDPDRDVIFSNPYIISAQVVLVNADSDIKTINDLIGKKIGVQTGSTGENAAEEIKDAELSSISDSTMLFQMLSAGNLDAVVCDIAVGDNYVENMGFVKLEESLIDENMSIIIHNDNTLLAEAINKAIDTFIESEKYTEIKEKWGV